MCGLAGCMDLRKEHRIEEGILRKMADALIHRGPDSSGFYIESNIGFGFRRLSIIDLQTGDQPLFNEDRSLALICNGEIYNHVELRRELEEKGHIFSSRSDVEVLLHLYEEHGEELLQKLNGQFAFAIYDCRERTLFLARDHFGICPLCYTVADGLLIFASEAKAILQHPLVLRAVDLTGLDQALSLPGPISPRTLFKNIAALPPAHCMTVRNGEIKIREYWDLDYPVGERLQDGKGEGYYEERLRELFEKSVQYRLQADVPVGFFLSGGLDSSMIAAMIRRISPGVQRHSFSINFADPTICESRYQRLMSQWVDSIHHDIPFYESDILSRLSETVYHAECPLKESYNTASLALSRETRRSGVAVVLNGEGADELFGGYVGYRFDKRRAASTRPYDIDSALGNEIRERIWGDPHLRYEKDEYVFEEVKAMLYSHKLSEHLDSFDCFNFRIIDQDRIAGRHPVHKRSYLDFKLRLAGHLIADHGDRMAMANSVEARYPFLDINLVEFCREIPADFKLNGFHEKWILKKAAEGLVPREIIEREKFPFVGPGTPTLLRQKSEWVEDLLSYETIKAQGYFNPETVELLKRKYSNPGASINQTLEDDLLMVVLTFGVLLDTFQLPALN